jgi:phosphopantothenate---cysteine ligase (ATP)
MTGLDAILAGDASGSQCSDIRHELECFLASQVSDSASTVGGGGILQRPVALVSSGGTAADLERNPVRSLENFSTGYRGAVAVEEFLRRGYAVIHLQRTGSASPFARVVCDVLSSLAPVQQANHGLSLASLGKLMAVGAYDVTADNDPEACADDYDAGEDIVRAVLAADTWLTDDPSSSIVKPSSQINADGTTVAKTDPNAIRLRQMIEKSPRVRQALRERSDALATNRLLTIPFRTVEEYIRNLQLATKCLHDCHALALVFLAAAVSDYYIPFLERPEHKLQSRDGGERPEIGGILTLRLHPVPKVISNLRKEWAPDAFCVVFKLETDSTILRRKVEQTVDRYGCHLVVGNLLDSRHQKVWVFAPPTQSSACPRSGSEWTSREFTKQSSGLSSVISVDPDNLEAQLMDFVVESHFEYISYHYRAGNDGASSAPSIKAHGSPSLSDVEKRHRNLRERKRALAREMRWRQIQRTGLEIFGALAAFGISYAINQALRQRMIFRR